MGTASKKLRVLVVDDNDDCSDALCDCLESLGASATSVGSGLEAMHSLDGLPPHLMLVDLELLGGMSGIELVQVLRVHPLRATVLVVAVTGHVEERIAALEAGFDQFIAKPVMFRTLEVMLDRLRDELGDIPSSRPVQ